MAIKVQRLRIFLSLGVGTVGGTVGAILGALLAALIGANPVTGMTAGGAIGFVAVAGIVFAVLA